MTECYVLVNTQADRVWDAARLAENLEGVESVEAVSGAYDLILRVSAGTVDQVVREITPKLQAIPWVLRAIPCPVATHHRLWQEQLEPAFAG